jgi:hypothetical protein
MQKGGEGGVSGAVEKNKKKRAHLGDGPRHRHPRPRHRHLRPRRRHPHPRRRHPHPRRRRPRPRRCCRRCSCRHPRCFPGHRRRCPSLSSSSRPLSSLLSLFRIHWHCGWCGQKKNERIKKKGQAHLQPSFLVDWLWIPVLRVRWPVLGVGAVLGAVVRGSFVVVENQQTCHVRRQMGAYIT